MGYAPTTNIPTIGRCYLCKQQRTTRFVSLYVTSAKSSYLKNPSLHANLCKSCIHKTFWKFTGKNLLALHLGIFGLMQAPFYIVQNTATYLKALYKLRGTPP
jgi:hypothetical protein